MQKEGPIFSPLLVGIGFALAVWAAPGAAPRAADPGDSEAGYALSRQGDAENGKRVFGRCRACHALRGNAPKAGPSLENIFGRPAGTLPGYPGYSKALRESGIVWNEQSLNHWVTDPRDFLPGNKMNVAPIREAQQRMDLIAYLRQQTDRP